MDQEKDNSLRINSSSASSFDLSSSDGNSFVSDPSLLDFVRKEVDTAAIEDGEVIYQGKVYPKGTSLQDGPLNKKALRDTPYRQVPPSSSKPLDYSTMSSVDWLEMFPEVKKTHGRIVKDKLKLEKFARELAIALCDQDINEERMRVASDLTVDASNIETETTRRCIGTLGVRDFHEQHLDRINRDIRRVDAIGKPIRQGSINKSEIEKAKNIDISKILEVNRAGFARCFSHNDKGNPNLYCRKGFAYCFVCNKSWDTIGIIMERDGLKFRDAVNYLIGL